MLLKLACKQPLSNAIISASYPFSVIFREVSVSVASSGQLYLEQK